MLNKGSEIAFSQVLHLIQAFLLRQGGYKTSDSRWVRPRH